MDWLNYHHLLNFWLVARQGGIQPASRVLHVSPASVSIQVRQLERTLGVKLFEKQGRRLVLTGMGELVAEYSDDIFQTGRELMETVKGNPAGRPMVFSGSERSAVSWRDSLRSPSIENNGIRR